MDKKIARKSFFSKVLNSISRRKNYVESSRQFHNRSINGKWTITISVGKLRFFPISFKIHCSWKKVSCKNNLSKTVFSISWKHK
jgi:hypothetical protein